MGRVDGTGLPAVEGLRASVDLLAGEARRESVLRMTDLRFTGCGSAEESIGSAGRSTLGYASWSL